MKNIQQVFEDLGKAGLQLDQVRTTLSKVETNTDTETKLKKVILEKINSLISDLLFLSDQLNEVIESQGNETVIQTVLENFSENIEQIFN